MTITVAEGEAFAARWLKACADGFHNNNHRESMKGIFADHVSWSFSDGTKVSRYWYRSCCGSGFRFRLNPAVPLTSFFSLLSSFLRVKEARAFFLTFSQIRGACLSVNGCMASLSCVLTRVLIKSS